jgi:alkylated DNA nucleotide flippase Atl1
MAPGSSQPFARLQADLRDLIVRIPPGKVVSQKDLGRRFGVPEQVIVTAILALDADARDRVAWWRVVADGGAVGRHPLREEQLARLQRDGVLLSGVGIVQELADRKLTDLVALASLPVRRADEAPPPPRPPAPSRARGMKGRPTSTV